MRHLATWILLTYLVALPAMAIGPPINTDTPITLGLAGRGVRTFVKVSRASSDRLDGHVTTTLIPVVVPYNVTTAGVVGIIVPSIFKDVEQVGTMTSSSGLGDISLFAKYVVLQVDRHRETFRLAPKAVVKLPTADDNASPALGSGSTDVSLGLVGAWLKNRWGIYGEGLYRITGEGNGRQYGDAVVYNAALAYRLSPAVYDQYPARQVNAFVELNGVWKGRDEVDGEGVSDSGGHTLFWAPGIQYIPLSRLLVEASLQVPLLRNLDGTQMEPDWTVSVGGRVLLY